MHVRYVHNTAPVRLLVRPLTASALLLRRSFELLKLLRSLLALALALAYPADAGLPRR